MSKRTFGPKFTFPIKFPIPAHFCFEFLLKITLRGHYGSRLYCFNAEISLRLGLIIYLTIQSTIMKFPYRVNIPRTILPAIECRIVLFLLTVSRVLAFIDIGGILSVV